MDERYVQDIFETLDFLGIDWDEGPGSLLEFEERWSQLHRMEMYRDALLRLRDAGVLFACTCSRTQIAREGGDGGYPGTCRDKGIPLDAPDVSWRVRTDISKKVFVRGIEGRVIEGRLDPGMRDFIVRKKDGFPAYQLTSILDDLYFGVDLIVRGQDLWPSTLAQLYLAPLLPGGEEFLQTCFYHHALLKNADGGKLSKSEGAMSIRFLRGKGYSPEDIYGLISPLL
jgi:glutamyl-tRNA synthetase